MRALTASKDDIACAGLEIIHRDMLSTYEDANKCLLCLDDYADQDDIRLLLCRYAFHKDCVDRWLSTGRNNCPACRTMGCVYFGVNQLTISALPFLTSHFRFLSVLALVAPIS
ncbi:hypothetical protein B0H14DRAFT_3439181 [Mycena olivaceomarginata]|nr:hypothetical protein B0H14DRAFT_3439181 [Mycena olivaceomarginata]